MELEFCSSSVVRATSLHQRQGVSELHEAGALERLLQRLPR